MKVVILSVILFATTWSLMAQNTKKALENPSYVTNEIERLNHLNKIQLSKEQTIQYSFEVFPNPIKT